MDVFSNHFERNEVAAKVLKSMSEDIEYTSHQLSEILNESRRRIQYVMMFLSHNGMVEKVGTIRKERRGSRGLWRINFSGIPGWMKRLMKLIE